MKGLFSFLIGVLIVIFLGTMVLADTEKVEKLTLADCLKAVTDDHPQVKMVLFKLQDVQMDLQKLKLEDPGVVSQQELAQAQAAVDAALKAVQDTKLELAQQIEAKYYQILKSIQMLKSKQDSLQWMEKQLAITKIKFDSGMISQKDMQGMNEQVEKARQDLDNTRFSLETVRMDFNLTLGWDLNRVFEPADQQFPFEPVVVTLDEITKYALEHTDKIKQAQAALDEARAELAFKKLSEVSQVEIKRAENAVTIAELSLDQARKETIIATRSLYVNIVSATEQVLEAKKAYEQAKKDQEVLKVKYEAGMIALLELVKGRTNLADEEIHWIQAIYDYNLLKVTFNQAIGKEYSPRQ